MKNQLFTISPSQVHANTTLSIHSNSEVFPHTDYSITDEMGRIIRKGSIATGLNAFYLSMVGMATGAYRLSLGQVQERFTII